MRITKEEYLKVALPIAKMVIYVDLYGLAMIFCIAWSRMPFTGYRFTFVESNPIILGIELTLGLISMFALSTWIWDETKTFFRNIRLIR
jgi:hypothetical protein